MTTMKILLVDDDLTSRAIMRSILKKDGHDITEFEDGASAIRSFPDNVDLVISDYYMPGMTGAEFYDALRRKNRDVPFIYITTEDNTTVAVELMRRGASDLIQKPIKPDSLRLRVERVMQDARYRREVRRIAEEEALVQMENQKLTNWRMLYASKDSRRTRQLIDNLSRNINHSGGFSWVEMLKEMKEEYDEDRYIVSKSILDLAISSAENHQNLIERITEIGMLSAETEPPGNASLWRAVEWIESYIWEHIVPFAGRYDRDVTVDRSALARLKGEERQIRWDQEIMERILWELACNGIKYSPEATPLRFELDLDDPASGCAGDCLVLRVRNHASRPKAQDNDGNPIVGVPYDYREPVFELFFTIESFPTNLPEEHWRDGTGLTFVRTLCQRLGGWAEIATGIDHSEGGATPLVTVTLRFQFQN